MGILLTVLYMGVGSWNGMTFMWLYNSYYIWRWLISLISLVFIALYNGTRGKQVKWSSIGFILLTLRELRFSMAFSAMSWHRVTVHFSWFY